MENSIISPSDFSRKSNPSTARLLINHIKRLVEDDMKLTVDAFKYIENKIVFEQDAKTMRKKNVVENNVIIRKRLNRSNVHLKKLKHSTTPSSQPSKLSTQTYTDELSDFLEDSHFSGPQASSTPRSGISKSLQDNVSQSVKYEHLISNSDLSNVQNEVPNHSKHSDSWNGPKLTNINSYISKMDVTRLDDIIEDDEISLTQVRNSYSHFMADLDAMFNKINKRLKHVPDSRTKDVDQPALRMISNKISEDFSPTSTYGNGDNTPTSFAAPFRSPYKSKMDRKQNRLPQLLLFSGSTIINTDTTDYSYYPSDDQAMATGRIPQTTDDTPPTSDHTAEITDYATDLDMQRTNENNERTPDTDCRTDTFDGTEATDGQTETTDGRANSTDGKTEASDGKTEASDGRTETTDGKTEATDGKPLEQEQNNNDNDVSTTDIGSEISSTLLTTPESTYRESQHEMELTDLDEIASLINQATSSRRVVIKKKLPELAAKGYNKTCNEKLIFSGNKITHVKRDRKIMSRNISPQL